MHVGTEFFAFLCSTSGVCQDLCFNIRKKRLKSLKRREYENLKLYAATTNKSGTLYLKNYLIHIMCSITFLFLRYLFLTLFVSKGVR